MKNTILKYCYKKKNFYTLLILFSAVVLTNILTVGSIPNVIITLPQIIIVLVHIFKGDLKSAVLLHFCFAALSLSAQGTAEMFGGEQDILLLNYGTMKLVGPIRICYFFNVLFLILCISQKLKPHKDLLFYKLYKTFLLLGVTATIIGVFGLIFHPYYSFSGFIGPFVYMFVVISSCYILSCIATNDLIEIAYYLSIICLFSGIIGSYIAYLLGVVTSYSEIEVIYTADIVYFGALLIPGIIFIKEKLPLYICIFILFLISTVVLSGKGVFCIGFELLCLFYYMFICKDVVKEHHSQIIKLRPFK